jgi:YD repeat-containing protein
LDRSCDSGRRNGTVSLTSVTDGDSNATSYACDHDGRMTSQTDANSNTESYSFNANGQVTSQTDKMAGSAISVTIMTARA